jgi:hypothetical protein
MFAVTGLSPITQRNHRLLTIILFISEACDAEMHTGNSTSGCGGGKKQQCVVYSRSPKQGLSQSKKIYIFYRLTSADNLCHVYNRVIERRNNTIPLRRYPPATDELKM